MSERKDKYDYGPYSETAREAGPVFTTLAVGVFFPLFFLMVFGAFSYFMGAHWPVEIIVWLFEQAGFDTIYSMVPLAAAPNAASATVPSIESVTLLSDTATVRAKKQAELPNVELTKDLQIANLREVTRAVATRHEIHPGLLYSVLKAESAQSPTAVSHAGALGLMQLMPKTAKSLDIDPYDPLDNIRGGAIYLRKMLDRFDGNVRLALAAYNAGPGAVRQYNGVPPYDETRKYILKVIRHFQRYLNQQTHSSS